MRRRPSPESQEEGLAPPTPRWTRSFRRATSPEERGESPRGPERRSPRGSRSRNRPGPRWNGTARCSAPVDEERGGDNRLRGRRPPAYAAGDPISRPSAGSRGRGAAGPGVAPASGEADECPERPARGRECSTRRRDAAGCGRCEGQGPRPRCGRMTKRCQHQREQPEAGRRPRRGASRRGGCGRPRQMPTPPTPPQRPASVPAPRASKRVEGREKGEGEGDPGRGPIGGERPRGFTRLQAAHEQADGEEAGRVGVGRQVSAEG